MLSIESPSTDPSCPQRKLCDESASLKPGLPVADLSKSATVNQTSFPEFSIREYVLSSRSKDIKANWPFSSKTLELCFKHGVKDILPPFQPEGFERTAARWDHHGVLNSSNFAKSNEKQRQRFMKSKIRLSPSEINLIPTIRSSNSPLEFDTLSEAPTVADSAEPRISQKIERTSKPLVKKCRFSVKYGAQAYRASGGDIVSNSTPTSETMASKTCPVCKSFSSPSNTTLNAHIDQCLSVESTTAWTLDSKSMKHKFKPRKTKLLADIYTTALPCTLEDLDRRNGTTWAIASRPTPDIEKRGSVSLPPPKIANEDGVYFDTKGTKLRILSAFNDELWSKGNENLRSTRTEKEDGGIKFKLLNRKKWLESKRKKSHKLAFRRKNNSPQIDHKSQIDKVHDRSNELEEGSKMTKHPMKSRKPHDSGCLRQWICSKRTGVLKKVMRKEDQPKFKRKWLVTEDSLFQTDQSHLDDMKNEKKYARRLTDRSDNPICSPENINLSEAECLLYGRVSNNEGLVEYVKKRKPFAGDGFLMKPPNLNGDSCDILSKDCRANVFENTKLSKSSKNMSSFTESLSKSRSKSPPVKKRSSLTKSQTGSREKIDEKIISLLSEKDRRCQLLDRSSESCLEREDVASVLHKSTVKTNANRGRPLNISQRNETTGSTSFSSGSSTRKLCDDNKVHFSVDGDLKCFEGKARIESTGEVVQNQKESKTIKSSSEGMNLANSVNPNVCELFNSSMARSDLLQFSISSKQTWFRAEEQDRETDLEFDDRQESEAVIGYNAHETSPANSFNPILIPGPPGSFLPSPGTMESNEYQGNSSLTSSQVLSDEQDFIDGVSSDSPISSSSTFSTFTAARFDLDYFAPAQTNAIETKSMSALSSHNLEPRTENTTSRTKNLCCCQREEKYPSGVNSIYQKPQLLKPWPFSTLADSFCNKQKGYNLNRRLDDFEIPPLCCCNSSEDVFRSIRSPKELGVKLPDCVNFESATSSSSQPVLRLMGKNLMVMNKNEDLSSRVEQSKPSFPIIPAMEFPKNLNSSSGNSANKDVHFFHHRVHDDEKSWNYTDRRPDTRLLDGFRNHGDLKTSQTFLPGPEVLHPCNQTSNGGSIKPPRYHQMNANSRAFPDEENRSNIGGRPNCILNMAAYGPKYFRDFGANCRLTPGI